MRGVYVQWFAFNGASLLSFMAWRAILGLAFEEVKVASASDGVYHCDAYFGGKTNCGIPLATIKVGLVLPRKEFEARSIDQRCGACGSNWLLGGYGYS